MHGITGGQPMKTFKDWGWEQVKALGATFQ